MEALQVEYEESLPGLLEERLSDQLGATVVVYNTGVGDWQPDQYYLQARRSLATHDFDLILVALFVDNDVISVRRQHVQPRVPTQHHSLRFPRTLSMAEMVDALFYPINDFFEVRSHFFTLLKNRFQTALMRVRLSAAYFPDVFFREEADSNRWSVTAEICREIAAEGEARGIPTLFVLIPASYQVDTDIFHQYVRGFGIDTAAIDIDQPNHLLGAALRERSLHVIDALPALRDAFAAGTRPYGRVDRHFSPEGHATVADLVTSAIATYLAPDSNIAPSRRKRLNAHNSQ